MAKEDDKIILGPNIPEIDTRPIMMHEVWDRSGSMSDTHREVSDVNLFKFFNPNVDGTSFDEALKRFSETLNSTAKPAKPIRFVITDGEPPKED